MFSCLLQTWGSAEARGGTHARSAATFSKVAIQFILPPAMLEGSHFPSPAPVTFLNFILNLLIDLNDISIKFEEGIFIGGILFKCIWVFCLNVFVPCVCLVPTEARRGCKSP